MALTFDLVNALNNVGTGGEAIFGSFSCGTYMLGGHNHTSFQVFDAYEYVGGATYTPGSPYDTDTELGWMINGLGYPHIGIENINNNSEIRPNLWNESIYFHPGPTGAGVWTDSTSRPCVIRFTAPESGTVNINGNYLKGTETFPVDGGWAILKNGTAIFPRQVIGQGSSIPISLSSITISQGDVIDFVADVASDGATSDDSAITLTLELTLNKPPVAIVDAVNCTDEAITGIAPLVFSGTAKLYDVATNTLIDSAVLIPIPNSVNSLFSIPGNYNSKGSEQFYIIIEETGNSTPSDSTIFTIGNVGCVTCVNLSIESGATFPEGIVNELYEHEIVFSGSDITEIEYVQKPSWLNINFTGSVITLSGTPSVSGNYEIQLNISNDCDTFPLTLRSFDINEPCFSVTDGTIIGSSSITLLSETTYTITEIEGSAPYTYNWIVLNGTIISGQGTTSIVVNPTENPLTVKCNINNCANQSLEVSKIVFVKKGCIIDVPVDTICFTPVTITGTLLGLVEENRVLEFTAGILSFKAELGTRSYEFEITDIDGKKHRLVLKNIIC